MDQATETQNNTTKAVTPPPGITPPPVVTPKDISNGVTRPKLGSLTARVWQICDEQSAVTGAPAERAKVIEQAVAETINAATAATQHGKWRKYHGLVADTPEAKTEKAAKATAEKAAKKEAAAKVKANKAAAKAAAKVEADAETKAVAELVVETDAGDVAVDVTAVE